VGSGIGILGGIRRVTWVDGDGGKRGFFWSEGDLDFGCLRWRDGVWGCFESLFGSLGHGGFEGWGLLCWPLVELVASN
jgi:hypothetical protein